MVLHQIASHAAQGFLDGSDLHDDIGAIAVFFHHFLQTAKLPLDAAQSVGVGRFDSGIHGHGFAARWMSGMSFRRCPWVELTIGFHWPHTPRPYIYPYPLSLSNIGFGSRLLGLL